MQNIKIKNKATDVVKIDRCPSVHLIISDPKGNVLGVLGGESRGLSLLVEQFSKLDGFPIKKQESGLLVGQDVYTIPREFLSSFVGALGFLSWAEIQDLPKTVPASANLTLVVSY